MGLGPAIPEWVATVVFTVVLTASNLVAVRTYDEVEFWFVVIKVLAIVGFLGFGVLAIVGLLPGIEPPSGRNLFEQGGFVPNGWYPVLPALLVVIFAFNEARSSRSPPVRRSARRRRRERPSVQAVIRILVFYIGWPR